MRCYYNKSCNLFLVSRLNKKFVVVVAGALSNVSSANKLIYVYEKKKRRNKDAVHGLIAAREKCIRFTSVLVDCGGPLYEGKKYEPI